MPITVIIGVYYFFWGHFMVYGYVRVSTDKQTVENQRYEIQLFCQKNNINIEKWIEETISGIKEPRKRRLGTLLDDLGPDDLIICTELSRLGRNLLMIMSILSQIMATRARIWTIKDGYRLGDDIQSKVLAFAFGLSAEIERHLLSQRTREALARRKANGQKLGRPLGLCGFRKCSIYKDEILSMLSQGQSRRKIALRLGVHRNTVQAYVVEMFDMMWTPKPVAASLF
jgi:DNA invertase Pin-like site-specific DNA recombinase